MAAAPSAACELHLALLTIEESGSAEHTGYYGSRWGRRGEEDADQFEVIEVTDYSATLSNWVRADGAPCTLAAIPFEEDEISPPEALEDLEPDEEHFQEATGNEGASFERTYQRAALTLWHAARRLAVLNQGGLKLTLPYLAGLAASWEAAGANAGTALWHEADDLCGLMIASWPAARGYPRGDESESPEAGMLALLTRFKNAPRIEAFLARVSAGGAFGGGDAESIVHAAQVLPAATAAELIERIVAANTARDLSACGRLLAQSAGRIAPLTGAGRVLVEALPGEPAKTPEGTFWYRRPPSVEPGFVAALIGALDRNHQFGSHYPIGGIGMQSPASAMDALAMHVSPCSRPATNHMEKSPARHLMFRRDCNLPTCTPGLEMFLKARRGWVRTHTFGYLPRDNLDEKSYNQDENGWIASYLPAAWHNRFRRICAAASICFHLIASDCIE